MPGIENSSVCEIHGGLGVLLPKVNVFLWSIYFETPGGRLWCERQGEQVVMGSGQLESLLCGMGFEPRYFGESSSNLNRL